MKAKFDDTIIINGIELNKKYVQSLTYEQREELVEPILKYFREYGFPLPDDTSYLKKEYQKLIDYEPDLTLTELYNNSSMASDINKYFCSDLFYNTTEKDKKTMTELFEDNDVMRKLIRNRMGMDWLKEDKNGKGVNEAFNFTHKMLLQGMRSMRLVNMTSIFKNDIAKFMALKYCPEDGTWLDYSAGFGNRFLGAMSANINYIGIDPLTIPNLQNMANFLEIDKSKYTFYQCGSEAEVIKDLPENSVDFVFSSPPYLISEGYDDPKKKKKDHWIQEYYTKDLSQAYNNGEDYFYDKYWRGTLENMKKTLKPGGWFGLNIFHKANKQIDIMKEYFEVDHIIKLRTIKSHLSGKKKDDKESIEKFEPIFMCKNNK